MKVNQHSPPHGFPYDVLNNKFQYPSQPDHILRTPGLQRLASQSIRLVNNHAPSSVCAPSRSALWLGRSVGFNRIRSNSNPLIGVNELDCESPDWIPWTKVIQNLGYDTYFLGKWGLGATTGHPRKCGFSYFQGYPEHGGAIGLLPFPPLVSLFNASEWNPKNVKDDMDTINFPENANYNSNPPSEARCTSPDGKCTNMDERIYKKALNIISKYINKNMDQNNNNPFFLAWAPLTPHVARYYFPPNTRMKDAPLNTSPVSHLGIRTKTNYPTWGTCERGHAAQIESSIDRDMNGLLDLLESSPTLNKNTIVIFASDNGPHNECDPVSEHNLPQFFMGAGGLLGQKTTMWEGGLRVPTMVRWFGKIPGGGMSRIPGTSLDFVPSLFDAIGYQPVTNYDGSSLLLAWMKGDEEFLLQQQQQQHQQRMSSATSVQTTNNVIELRSKYFQTEICRDPFEDKSCVTATYSTSDWPRTLYKMIRHESSPTNRAENGNPPIFELFELVSDPKEMNNLLLGGSLNNGSTDTDSTSSSKYQAVFQELLDVRSTLRTIHPSDPSAD
jgi:arylsulfatase A